jgi:hypothetical protein
VASYYSARGQWSKSIVLNTSKAMSRSSGVKGMQSAQWVRHCNTWRHTTIKDDDGCGACVVTILQLVWKSNNDEEQHG